MPAVTFIGGPLDGRQAEFLDASRPIWRLLGKAGRTEPRGPHRDAYALEADCVSVPIDRATVEAKSGLVLELPWGFPPEKCIELGLVRLYLDTQEPPPSIMGKIARYRLVDGEWEYVPHVRL
jgi:hypothetical protein